MIEILNIEKVDIKTWVNELHKAISKVEQIIDNPPEGVDVIDVTVRRNSKGCVFTYNGIEAIAKELNRPITRDGDFVTAEADTYTIEQVWREWK